MQKVFALMLAVLFLVCIGAAGRAAAASSFNCSFNGALAASGSTCECASGWTGRYCHQLDLLPAQNGSGLDQLHAEPFISTWGGSVLYDNATEQYHMYASEITKSCGIHRWVTNSIVVHAVSKGPPAWKFERKGEVKGLFTHEPIATRAPTGEFVVYVTHYPGDASDCPVCNCTDGSSASGGGDCAGECGGGKNKTLFSYFTYSKQPDGPWSPLQSLCATQMGGDASCVSGNINTSNGNPHTDMNLAPVIKPDGSLKAWTRWDIWEASDWKDSTTYKDTGQAPDFNMSPPTPWEGEDVSSVHSVQSTCSCILRSLLWLIHSRFGGVSFSRSRACGSIGMDTTTS